MELVIYRYRHLVPLKLYRATWKSHIGEVKADKDEVLDSVAGLFERQIRISVEAEAIAIAYAGYCGLGK